MIRGTGFPRIVGNSVDKGAFETSAPTAAGVTVSGRVTNQNGMPVSKARIYMTGNNSITRIATTNGFGYYSFDTVPAGETFVFNVISKTCQFDPQVVNITQDISELNFTAQP